MKELKEKYINAKNRAKEMMQAGNISGHIAQLSRVQQLQLQLINFSLNPAT